MDFFIVDRWAHTHFYSLSLFEKEKEKKRKSVIKRKNRAVGMTTD